MRGVEFQINFLFTQHVIESSSNFRVSHTYALVFDWRGGKIDFNSIEIITYTSVESPFTSAVNQPDHNNSTPVSGVSV